MDAIVVKEERSDHSVSGMIGHSSEKPNRIVPQDSSHVMDIPSCSFSDSSEVEDSCNPLTSSCQSLWGQRDLNHQSRSDGGYGEAADKSSSPRNSMVALPGVFEGHIRPVTLPSSLKGTALVKREAQPLSMVLPLSERRQEVDAGHGLVSVIAPRSSQSRCCKQFWKAGEYEGENLQRSASVIGFGMDHVRVHPKFLHSNATCHKWALGAFAELLDNALDEVCNGATFVHIDTLKNEKDGTPMLLVEDNGGGMTPDKMRQCMSLGYSAKSKMANTIGQYGNGFKTSTMRLGADVIVFSRSQGNDGRSFTQSIGLLSYTFLRGTGKEDIVVPIVDYEREGEGWKKMVRSSLDDWDRNLAAIVQWSPYTTESQLLQEFNSVKEHGTRIIIYNLWEDDEGCLELDLDYPHDIQIRGINRDVKNIQMAEKYPNSWHFLTYWHSLRSYASILYLHLPSNFRIILCGKEVEHHNLIDDMMSIQEVTYRPQHVPEGMLKNSNMVANVTIGFVKDAKHHIDVQGFNVYHKNRLIKPFWRVWNAAGSDGRGVIGVLEANFIEPAHDKQGFERTTVLSRLEARLISLQKNYWSSKCQEIGYAPRLHGKSPSNKESAASDKVIKSSGIRKVNGNIQSNILDQVKRPDHMFGVSLLAASINNNGQVSTDCFGEKPIKLEANENLESRKRLKRIDGTMIPVENTLNDLHQEGDKLNALQMEVYRAQLEIDRLEKENIATLDLLERAQMEIDRMEKAKEEQDLVEQNLRKSLKSASETINSLIKRVKQLEGKGETIPIFKVEPNF